MQVINWQTHSGSKAMLVRPNSIAEVNLLDARSGSSYQLDFWTYVVREGTSDRNMYIVVRGEGNDINGSDVLAYQVHRATGSTLLDYYDGVGGTAWISTTANQVPNQ